MRSFAHWGAVERSRPEESRLYLSQRRIEHDFADGLARFHQPVRLGSARQRQNSFDLCLDLAFGGGGKAFWQVGCLIAGPPLDGDALVVEVGEIDANGGTGVGASGHQPSAGADRPEGARPRPTAGHSSLSPRSPRV